MVITNTPNAEYTVPGCQRPNIDKYFYLIGEFGWDRGLKFPRGYLSPEIAESPYWINAPCGTFNSHWQVLCPDCVRRQGVKW